jgi:O-antigen/teichoic acid export membrane protein
VLNEPEIITKLASRESKVARQSLNSTLILAFGNTTSTIILAITSLLVARLLGPGSYGVYTLALSLPLFLQLLVGFGARTAITRYSAYYISQDNIAAAKRITKHALVFMLLSSTGFTALSVALAGFMSSIFLHRPELVLYVQIASILIFSQGVFNLTTPTFMGWGFPSQAATWITFQAILKLIISITLILLGLGVFGALYGYVVSYLLAGIFGVLLFYITKFRQVSTNSVNVASRGKMWRLSDFVSDVRKLVGYGLPLYTGNVILVFSQQPFFAVILSIITTNAIIGYYSAALNISGSVAIVSQSLTLALLPAFTKLDGIHSDTGTAFRYAVKYVSYFMMPAILFMIVSSKILIALIYGESYLHASYYLELLSLAYLPYAFGYPVLTPFFNGLGKTRLTMIMDTVETIATLLPIFIFVFWFNLGVNGLLYSIIISNIAPTLFGLFAANKYARARVDYISLASALFVSIICYLFVYAASYFLLIRVNDLIAFALELVIFFGSYLSLLPLSGAIRMEDVTRLRASSRGLRITSRLLGSVLNYEAFILENVKNSFSKRN